MMQPRPMQFTSALFHRRGLTHRTNRLQLEKHQRWIMKKNGASANNAVDVFFFLPIPIHSRALYSNGFLSFIRKKNIEKKEKYDEKFTEHDFRIINSSQCRVLTDHGAAAIRNVKRKRGHLLGSAIRHTSSDYMMTFARNFFYAAIYVVHIPMAWHW